MTAADWMPRVLTRLAQGGIDLARAFDLATFHARAPESEWLETFGLPHPLALVLGNTRALWPCFLDALAGDPKLCAEEHPLDAYVERVVLAALADVPVPFAIAWGHHRAAPFVPLQRIAAAAGLAELGPAHLSVHPEHGPWIGLRAVIVFRADAAEVDLEPAAPSRCASCEQPCRAALAHALTLSQEPSGDFLGAPAGSGSSPPPFSERQRAWVRVRDVCPVGRDSRYSALQLHYHYTKDRSTLEKAVTARQAELNPTPRCAK